jgi:mono/diheme cytochrome c family protein
MSRRILLAAFREEDHLLSAVRAVRSCGATIVDVYSPYAVHGLDDALGWRPSRLTWACGLCGGAGALFMLWFQFWTSATDWPLNIGGKPFDSLPAFVPVIFEAMVLCGAVGTVLAFFAVAGLRPGKRAESIGPPVTDDRFALLIEQTDATFDASQMSALLKTHHAEQIEERVLDGRPGSGEHDPDACSALWWVNVGLAAVFVIAIMAVLVTPRNLSRPNVEFLPTMRRSVPVDPQTALAGLPPARPIAGTIARDARPLHYQATAEDEKRAGEELASPLQSDDAAALEQGRVVYVNFCSSCHGPDGQGDGPMALRGYPPPPPLTVEKSRLLKDGTLFHVISYGRNNMPAHRNQLSQPDRWKAVLHIRDLQRRAVQQAKPAATAAKNGGKNEKHGTDEKEPPPVP